MEQNRECWDGEGKSDENYESHDADNSLSQESFLRPLCYVR